MSSSEFIGVVRQLFGLGAYDAYVNNRTIYQAVSPVVEILDKLRNGDISEDEAESQIDYWRQFDVRDDLHDYFYRNALRQQYSLSLSGGGAKSSHLVSIGHDRNADNEVGNGLDRTTIRVSNLVQPIAPLRIEHAINYNYHNATNNPPRKKTHKT